MCSGCVLGAGEVGGMFLLIPVAGARAALKTPLAFPEVKELLYSLPLHLVEGMLRSGIVVSTGNLSSL